MGCEVSLPNLRFRLDVGAYRPGSRKELKRDARLNTNRSIQVAAIGVAALFECKASRPDLVRDCRSAARLIERMKVLTERRLNLESLLKIHYPSLRNGDVLWPEYETVAFDQAEHAPSRKILKELATLSRQLHGQTKMESLMKWQAANLHYLVVEPALVKQHEIPAGWGMLVREGQRLELRVCDPSGVMWTRPHGSLFSTVSQPRGARRRTANRVSIISPSRANAGVVFRWRRRSRAA